MNEADELRLIAQRLLDVAKRNEDDDAKTKKSVDKAKPFLLAGSGNATNEYLAKADPDVLYSLAFALYKSRRFREKLFDKDLFGEPAWDMLLDLFIHKSNGKTVSVTSLCIASRVPPTTALRWITLLTDAGLVLREEDTFDGRRAFIRLSADGEMALRRYLVDTLDLLRVARHMHFTESSVR